MGTIFLVWYIVDRMHFTVGMQATRDTCGTFVYVGESLTPSFEGKGGGGVDNALPKGKRWVWGEGEVYIIFPKGKGWAGG